MTNQIFRDYIPDGEEVGAFTDKGFQDFVPEPEPKPQVVEAVEQVKPIKKGGKK